MPARDTGRAMGWHFVRLTLQLYDQTGIVQNASDVEASMCNIEARKVNLHVRKQPEDHSRRVNVYK